MTFSNSFYSPYRLKLAQSCDCPLKHSVTSPLLSTIRIINCKLFAATALRLIHSMRQFLYINRATVVDFSDEHRVKSRYHQTLAMNLSANYTILLLEIVANIGAVVFCKNIHTKKSYNF